MKYASTPAVMIGIVLLTVLSCKPIRVRFEENLKFINDSYEEGRWENSYPIILSLIKDYNQFIKTNNKYRNKKFINYFTSLVNQGNIWARYIFLISIIKNENIY